MSIWIVTYVSNPDSLYRLQEVNLIKYYDDKRDKNSNFNKIFL